MKVVGRVESLWRYPVKSMRGEELQEAFIGFAGVYGDRVYAFHSSAAPKGFPYLTGREQEEMLLYQPAYRYPARMSKPPNLAEAEALGPGVTPVYASGPELAVDVRTPSGALFAIDDPLLIRMLREGIPERHELTLLRSDRAMTDCRPVSLFSIQSVRQLSQEVGTDLDKRRFRANLYIELESGRAFAEEEFVGKTLQIGAKAVVTVTDRDPRCKMITLDPDTAQANPDVMRCVARAHDCKVGIYAAVLVEGSARRGDEIALLN
ncbi:MAG TPA: MOSC domain-containing protein [Bryobacteraceae bacterium]|nr:MOSC domain-containing protein [Bryobacteraceae bacterium]